jgi:hypothetical protein
MLEVLSLNHMNWTPEKLTQLVMKIESLKVLKLSRSLKYSRWYESRTSDIENPSTFTVEWHYGSAAARRVDSSEESEEESDD